MFENCVSKKRSEGIYEEFRKENIRNKMQTKNTLAWSATLLMKSPKR